MAASRRQTWRKRSRSARVGEAAVVDQGRENVGLADRDEMIPTVGSSRIIGLARSPAASAGRRSVVLALMGRYAIEGYGAS